MRDVTEGNPFFVGEVVAALGGNGDPGAALTPRVRDVVRWRLARLPDGTADVLAAAAVAGAEFDADVLADAIDVELEPGAGRARGRRARAARASRRGSGSLQLRARARARRRSSTSCRPAGACACTRGSRSALERAAATRAVAAGDLAAHFDAAGTLVDAAAALRYARAAGDEAAARLAFDVAAEQYERALRAHGRLPSAPEAERLDLELARGRALSLAGDERADAAPARRRGRRRAPPAMASAWPRRC